MTRLGAHALATEGAATERRHGLAPGAEGSRGAVASESTVCAPFVTALIDALEQTGLSCANLVSGAQLETSDLGSAEARLPLSKVCRFFDLALELTGDQALGLHFIERETGVAFNPVAHLLAHSASLRQAFEAVLQFQSLLRDEPSYELAEHGGQVTLRCFSPLGQSSHIRRFWAEMMVTGAFRLIRTFDSRALPERVSFEHAAPPYAAEYERIFEGTQRFEEPFAGITFDRALFEVRSPYEDEGLHRAIRRVAETRKLRLRRGAPYGQRVRELLVQERCPRWIDMDTVARALGLSARSLRRRLASEGTSYKTVESDALAIVAKQLLQDERLSIRETAREMGFSETTAFYRAFKRWTGTTPGAYRERDQPGASG